MEAQINQNSSQNAAQKEKVVLFDHFYEKLAFFLIRVVNISVTDQPTDRLTDEGDSTIACTQLI